MAQIDILPAQSAVDFDYEFERGARAPAVSVSSAFALAHEYNYKEKINAAPRAPAEHDPHTHRDEDVVIPGLPPLLRGHPDVHLRRGVIAASQLAASGESDAEKAFFVADLSSVYRQHEKWKKHLPEIEPFYGAWRDSISRREARHGGR